MSSSGELGGRRVGDEKQAGQERQGTWASLVAVIEASPSDQSSPLFSLLNGEGAGAMLAAAAGDVAGGVSPVGYSALTQQATVLAYHLLRYDGVEKSVLADEWLELFSDHDSPNLYRSPSTSFTEFLEAVRRGEAAATADPSAEPAGRVFPVGVWYRHRPDHLVEGAIAASRATHADAASVVAAAATAGAVAASCFAQSGRDLLAAAGEVAERCMESMDGDIATYSRLERGRQWVRDLQSLIRSSKDFSEMATEVINTATDDVARLPMAAILMAAPVGVEPYRQIEQAAALGGSPLGMMVGAMVGARVGIRSWPWVVPNDTWFAEIGRRLVSGNRETRDIPVPTHVEERLTLGESGLTV